MQATMKSFEVTAGMPMDGSKELYEMPETKLHELFLQVMAPDFYHIHEAEGTCFLNHPNAPTANVRADYLLFPRQHLVDLGFAETWFAVEIKRGQTHAEEAYTQAFWYTVSKFPVKDRLITPGFSSIWLPSRDDTELHGKFEPYSRGRIDGANYALDSAFSYLNVARFHLNTKVHFWTLYMHGNYARRYKIDEIKFDADEYEVVKANRTKFLLRVGNGQNICSHSGMMGQESA